MVEALKLELGTSYQTRGMVSEKEMTFEQENLRLQRKIMVSQQENIRLLQEVNDMKRENANQEPQLTSAYYKTHHLQNQLHSSASMGQVMMFIGGLVVAVLLFCYGIGTVDFSAPSLIDNDAPVVERQR